MAGREIENKSTFACILLTTANKSVSNDLSLQLPFNNAQLRCA